MGVSLRRIRLVVPQRGLPLAPLPGMQARAQLQVLWAALYSVV
jgi:hypothetical protein